MTKLAYLPLFAADWLADPQVTVMSPAARGVYVDLLCRAWLDGSIPAPIDGDRGSWSSLAALARTTVAALRRIWPEVAPHWEPDPGDPTGRRLVNGRLERERLTSQAARVQRQQAAKTRWAHKRGRLYGT